MNSPFIVGVLGHPELHPDDGAGLADTLAALVRELKQHLPDTELHFVVGAAEGTDLLVAHALRERGVHVQTMDTETLIRRCGLLVALWDGQPSSLPHEAANAVLRYLGVPVDPNHPETSIVVLDEADEPDTADRVVYWAPVARIAGAPLAAAWPPGFLRSLSDNHLHLQRHMPLDLALRLAELNNYNREFREFMADGRVQARDSLLASLPEDVPVDERMMLHEIDTQYGKADALAVHYQIHSDRLFRLFGLMAFAMGLAYLVYDKFRQWNMLLVIYLVALLSSVALYYALRGKQWFAKHLTYRVLAETMRAQFYLRLARVDHRVDAARILMLSGIDHFQGFRLISYVLASVAMADAYEAEHDIADPGRSRCIEQTWIENQHRYFVAKVANLERSSRRVKRLQQIMFIVILLVIATMFLFADAMDHLDVGLGVSLRNMLTFWMGFLALVLGIWQLHEHKMASRELLWQYRNQCVHFAKAKRQLSQLTSIRRRKDVLAELGRVSLMESYLWTIHRYHREHEPPATP